MPDRQCGSCTLCCRLLPVRELQKPSNTRCQHQGRQGCGIYQQPGFPVSCHLWSCRWLLGYETEDMPRPDRCGWVIDVMPDMVTLRNEGLGEVAQIEVVVVWVEPGRDVLKDRRLVRYIERQGEQGRAVILRHGTSIATAVFGSAMSGDGKMHIVDRDHMLRAETKTGNMLLDRMKEAIDAAERSPLGERAAEGGDNLPALPHAPAHG